MPRVEMMTNELGKLESVLGYFTIQNKYKPR